MFRFDGEWLATALVLDGDERVIIENAGRVDRGEQVVVAAERVWRIGVDDIEEPAAQTRDFREDVARDGHDRRIPLVGQLLDRSDALEVLLDGGRRGRAARDRFEGKDAAAG